LFFIAILVITASFGANKLFWTDYSRTKCTKAKPRGTPTQLGRIINNIKSAARSIMQLYSRNTFAAEATVMRVRFGAYISTEIEYWPTSCCILLHPMSKKSRYCNNQKWKKLIILTRRRSTM